MNKYHSIEIIFFSAILIGFYQYKISWNKKKTIEKYTQTEIENNEENFIIISDENKNKISRSSYQNVGKYLYSLYNNNKDINVK